MHHRARRGLRPARPLFEPLEDRVLYAAQPVATVDAPATVTLGGTFAATVTFDNVPDGGPGSDVGYAPILDVVLPTNGADGSGPGGDPPFENDGVTFLGASFLGRPIEAVQVAFGADGSAAHPFLKDPAGRPLVVNAADFGAAAGDTLVALRLPFGSFTPDQPAAAVTLSLQLSPLADIDVALPIAARGAFAFGLDPLNNPALDPPVIGGIVSQSIQPTVITVAKSFDGPEGETATGPNFPRTYRITVDVAEGQTLTDLAITDRLPDGVVLPAGAGSISVSGLPGAAVTFDPLANDFTVFAAGPVVGVAGADATITVRFHVGEFLAPGDPATPVLGPGVDTPREMRNDVAATADWTPLDPRDPPRTIVVDPPGAENVFIAKPLATQKSVVLAVDRGAPGAGPGDTLEWRIAAQLSDFVSLSGLVITDRLSDGQSFDASAAPTLTLSLGGTITSLTLDPADYTVVRSPTDGTTALQFRIGDRLGVVQGGEASGAATTFTLAYRSTIDTRFLSPGAPGDGVVGQGDSLGNSIAIAGASVDSGGTPVGGAVTDDSGAGIGIATGRVDKSIYRINGVAPPPGTPAVVSGDLVTFRLTYSLPQSSYQTLVLADFLPLPVFDISAITVTFDDTVSADAPAENVVKWGPDAGAFDSLLGPTRPVLAIDAASNQLLIRFDDPLRADPSLASTVDLLFTLRVADRPFGDGLALTNVVQGVETNAAGRATASVAIAGLTLSEPNLRLTKGIVAFAGSPGELSAPAGPVPFTPPGSAGNRFAGTISSDALAAQPIDADLNNMDAGDLVTFAIVIENTGSGRDGAFDVVFTDTLPQGFVVPAAGANYRVTDGAGNPIPFIGISAGGFFTSITLVDSATGAIARFDPASGANVAIITYDLQVFETVQPGSVVTNVAFLRNYAAFEGGTDRTVNDPVDELIDTASVAIGLPTIAKTIVSTSLPETGSDQGNPAIPDLTIGERVVFDIVLTLREGDYRDLVLRDLLPLVPGQLDLVSASVVAVGANIRERDPDTLLTGGPVAPVVTPEDTTGDGRLDRVTVTFGARITNLADNVVDDNDRIVLRVEAAASNAANTGAGDVLRNLAEATFLAPAAPATIADAALVEIVEPRLAVTKTAVPTEVQAEVPITYTFTVRHTAADYQAPAFDLVLADLLDLPELDLIPGTIAVSGAAGGATILEGNAPGDARVIIAVPVLRVGETLTVSFQGKANVAAQAGQTLPNLLRADWSSLPGADPAERAYVSLAAAAVSIPGPGVAKQVVATDLPETGSEFFRPGVPDVAIGETITYRVTLTLPEATNVLVSVTDLLPAGAAGSIAYVDGSFRIVSLGANLSGPGLATPSVTASNRDDSDGLGLLDTLVIGFGTVVNTPDGQVTDADRIILEFEGRVANAPNNVAGLGLDNVVEVDFGFGTIRATAPVDVVEPTLNLTKSGDRTSGDAGDIVRFTIEVPRGAANTGPAYDMVVTDALSPFYQLLNGSVRVLAGPAGAVISTGNGAGDASIRIDVPVYTPTDPRLVIQYEARVLQTVEPTQVIENTARVTFDSVRGSPGPVFEREGIPAQDSHLFTVTAPALSKRVVATDIPETGFGQFNPLIQDVAIGETVTYLVAVTLPEGTTRNAVLEDIIPTPFTIGPLLRGVLEYLDSAIVSVGGNLSGPGLPAVGTRLVASDLNGDGLVDRIALPVGTIVNRSDDVVSDADRIIFSVTARVIDLPINQPGLPIINRANLLYDALGEPRQSSVTETVEIVGPSLEIAKAVSAATADAGNTLTYTVTVQHVGGRPAPADNSTQAAFEVVIEDLVPADVRLVAGSVRVTSTELVAPVIVAGNAPTDTTVRVLVPVYLLSAGPITLRFDAVPEDSVRPGQVVTNIATLDYASAPAALPGRPFDGEATASFVVPAPQFGKAIVATSLPETGSGQFDPTRPDVTVGETITYNLTARLIEGTQRVTIVDTLPTGLEILSTRVVRVGNAVDGAPPPAVPNVTGAALAPGAAGSVTGQTVTFAFGESVVNTGDNDPANDLVIVEVIARVRDIASNQSGTVLVNAAALDYGPNLSPVVGVGVDVVQPALAVEKTGPTTVQDAGDLVTYTVRIAHAANSTAAAFDLDVRDFIPTLLTLTGTPTVTFTGGPGTFTIVAPSGPSDPPLRVAIPVLTLGQTATITYRVTIGEAVTPGLNIVNTANLGYDTARGDGGRPLAAADDHVLRIRTPSVAKTTNVGLTSVVETGTEAVRPAIVDLTPGETVTFILTATLPEGTIRNLVIEDWLPSTTAIGTTAGILEYVSSRITFYGSGITGSALPPLGTPGVATDRVAPSGILDTVTWTLGTVINRPNNDPVGADSNLIRFEVTARLIDVPQNAANDQMTNTARLTYTGGVDGTQRVTTTGTVGIDTVEPRLQTVVKTGAPLTGDAGEVITYTVTVAHAAPFPGRGPAFDVAVTDLLAPGLRLVPGSVGTSLGTVTTGNGAADTTIRIDVPVYRPTDPLLTITYRAVLADSVTHGQTITNTVRVAYDSAPGDPPGQRVYPVLSDSETVTVLLTPGFAKTIVASSVAETGTDRFRPGAADLAIGETVTFQLVATLGEGTQPLTVSDVLPAGLVPLSATVFSVGGNISGNALGAGDAGTIAGQAITFAFGPAVTNRGDNVADANDTIVMRIVARVADVPGNVAGRPLDNTASADFGPAGRLAASAPADVVEPALAPTVKSVTNLTKPGEPADAGDILAYTVVLTRAPAASAPAFDLVVTDILPASLELVAGSASATLGTALTAGNTVTLSIPVWLLTDPGTVTLTYRARVADSVTDGSTITNRADTAFTSLPGSDPNERGYTLPPATTTVPVDFTPLLAKTVISPTVGTAFDPANPDVAVGESVTYRVVATLGEGTQAVLVVDALPEGLEALTATVVSVGANITGNTLGAGASGAIAADARTVTFDLGGSVTNRGDNVTDERDTVVFEVIARVRDIPAVQPGVVLANSATFDWGNGVTPPAIAPVDVVGPALAATKAADRAVVDAGDEVTFTVTVPHAPGATAPAYDLVLTDILPAGYALVAGSVTTTLGTVVAGGDVVRVEVPVYRLADPLLTVTYRAIVADSVRDAQVLANTVRVAFDSAAGPGGRPGAAEATATVLVDFLPAIAKTVTATSLPQTGDTDGDGLPDVAIGETVTFTLTVTPGQGTQSLVVTDSLPVGLVPFRASVVSVGGNVSGAALGAGDPGTIAGGTVTFDFGDAVVVAGRPGSAPGADDRIVLEIEARVADAPSNVGIPRPGNTVLSNVATVAYDGDGTPAPASATVEVVEPRLAAPTKTASAATADAGDEITFTVTVPHDPAATGPAFALRFTDTLPAGYVLVAGSAVSNLGAASTSGNTVTVIVPVYDLADPVLAVTYRAIVADTVRDGDVLVNTAVIAYASAPDGTPEQRAYDPVSGSDSVLIGLAQALEKAVITTSLPETGDRNGNGIPDVAIGETVTYRIIATLGEGTQRVLLSDTLPVGLRPLAATVETIGANISGALLLAGDPGAIADRTVTFDFGTAVTNSGGDGTIVTAADRITVLVTALVEDVPGNVTGVVLPNAAGFVTDNRVVPADPAPVEIVEPRLDIAKAAVPASALPGETVTYTLVVTHAAGSTAAAYDLVVQDLLGDPSLVLVSGSVTTTRGTVEAGNGAADTTVRIAIPLLDLGESATITFRVAITPDTPRGDTVFNTATIDFTSAPGGGRPGSGSVEAILPILPGLEKTILATSLPETGSAAFDPTVPDLAIGETVTYRLVVTLPEGTTEGLTVTDLLPVGLAGIVRVDGASVVAVGANLSAPGLVPGLAGILSDRDGDGRADTATFALGTVTNAVDRVLDDADRLVIDIVGTVVNDPANVGGLVLTNAARAVFSVNGRAGEAADSADAEVVRAGITLEKTAQVRNPDGEEPPFVPAPPGTVDAGDVITYRFVLTNPGTGPLFDVVLTDVLGPGIGSAGAPVRIDGVAGTVEAGAPPGETVLRVRFALLLPGDTATVTWQVLVDPDVPRFAFANAAAVDGASAAIGGIRQPDAEILTATDGLEIALAAPSLFKIITGTSLPQTGETFHPDFPTLGATPGLAPVLFDRVAIGELVTYDIGIVIAEGPSDLTLIDRLPIGPGGILQALSGTVIFLGAGVTSPALPVGAAGTLSDRDGDGIDDTITFDFGLVENLPDNIRDQNDSLVVRIVARVADVPQNAAGVQLQNTAEVTARAAGFPDRVLTDTTIVEIVEPRLGLTKTADRASGDAGELVTYTLTVPHLPGSTSAAFDLVITDALDPALLLVPGSITTTLGSVVPAGNAVRVEVPVYLLTDPVLTITFQARLADTVRIGQAIPNTATLGWDSAGGEGGRPGDAAAGTSLTAVFAPTLAKVVASTSIPFTGTQQFNPAIPDIVEGEVVTFRLIATLGEGTQQVIVIDDLPVTNGILQFLAARVVFVGGNISGALPTQGVSVDSNGDGVIDRVIFDFGPDVTNAGDNAVNDLDRIVMEIDLRATQRTGIFAGTVLTNSAVLDFGVGTTPPATASVEAIAVGAPVAPPALALFDRAAIGFRPERSFADLAGPSVGLLSGAADVGTALLFAMRDTSGRTIALASTIADPGGNWTASVQQTRAYVPDDRGTDAWRTATRLFGRGDSILPEAAYAPFLDEVGGPLAIETIAMRATAPPFAGPDWIGNARATFGSGLGPDPTMSGDPADIARGVAEGSAFLQTEQSLEAAGSLIALGWNKFSGEYLPRGTLVGG